jgi:hypothetical protein
MLLVVVAGGGLGWFTLQSQWEARRQWVIAIIQASRSWVDFDGMGIYRILRFGGGADHVMDRLEEWLGVNKLL